jgi:hypothetical protein
LALLLAGCGVEGSGRLLTLHPTVPEFSRLAVGGGLRVKAVLGPQSVALTLDDNLFRELEIEVVDDQLQVEPRPGVSIEPSAGSELAVSSPVLTGVELSGGCEGTAEVSPRSEQDFALSGASVLEVMNVSADTVWVALSGSSQLRLAGCAAEMDAALSGSSGLDSRVIASTVAVDLSGSSSGTLFAGRTVSGQLSGSSQLVVNGSPTRRDLATSGSSSVRFVE